LGKVRALSERTCLAAAAALFSVDATAALVEGLLYTDMMKWCAAQGPATGVFRMRMEPKYSTRPVIYRYGEVVCSAGSYNSSLPHAYAGEVYTTTLLLKTFPGQGMTRFYKRIVSNIYTLIYIYIYACKKT